MPRTTKGTLTNHKRSITIAIQMSMSRYWNIAMLRLRSKTKIKRVLCKKLLPMPQKKRQKMPLLQTSAASKPDKARKRHNWSLSELKDFISFATKYDLFEAPDPRISKVSKKWQAIQHGMAQYTHSWTKNLCSKNCVPWGLIKTNR